MDAEFARRVKIVLRDLNIVLYYKIQRIKEEMDYYPHRTNALVIQHYLTNYETLEKLLG
jgi:hypothetical protein